MKKIFTFLFLFSVSMSIFAQAQKVDERIASLESEVKTLKGNIETLNSQMSSAQAKLNELTDRYAQYQKQLNLKQVTSVTVDTIAYGVVNAVGDKATGTVTVTLSGINNGKADDAVQFFTAELNDFDGNIYSIGTGSVFDNVNIGSKDGSNRAIFRTNIPNKIYITFHNVSVGARISNLQLEEIAHHHGDGHGMLNFRDVNIDWK